MKNLLLILLLAISANSYCQMPNLNTKGKESVKPCRDGELYGFVEEGKIVIPCKYNNVWDFSEGLARVKLNGKMGCINKEGKIVVPIKYDFVFSFSEGLAAVILDGKYGYVNKVGEKVIPFLYDYAGSFSEGLAEVGVGGYYGHIDKEGRYITPVIYYNVGSFHHGLAKVKKNIFWGMVNNQGKEVLPCKYDDIKILNDKWIKVEKDSLYGLFKGLGEEIIPCKYDGMEYVNEGMFAVKKSNLWGFVDSLGVEKISPQYTYVGSFNNGLCQVSNKDGKNSYIDKQGVPLTKFIYDGMRPFSEGMAAVKKNKKWGFINEKGNEIIPCIYDSKWNGADLRFSDGLALVQKGKGYDDYLYINKANEIVYKFSKKTSPLPTTWRSYFSDGVAWIVSEDNLGNFVVFSIINTAGQIVKARSAYELNFDHLKYNLNRFENGYSYTGGKLIDKNLEIAAEIEGDSLYYKDEKALIELAKRYYEEGYFVTSLKILKKIPTNSYAQYVVGFMYQYGQGIPANEQEAIKCYKKSNEPEAKKQLAMLEGKEKIQEPIKKEEPILLADTKVQNNNSEIVTPQTPVESKTVITETSQDKIVAQNISQVQEQSKQLATEKKKKEKRIALVIGNSDYNEDMGLHPLTTPISDAYDMKKKLESIGFEDVVARTNLPYDSMKTVVEHFCDKAEGYDVALFYYSGHAVQHESHSILLPIGKRFENNSDFRNYSFNIEDILHDLKGDDEKQVRIFIIDACRDRYNDRYKGHTEDVKNFEPKEGEKRCFYAYATRLFEKAEDGSIRNLKHSPFTEVLLEKIDSPDLTINQLFEEVEKEVYYKLTDKKQEPRHNNNLPMDLKNFTFLIK